jgi:2-polyprenyl-3-methyl-5-hydroxy-6-metoxy-1,4-benzoquinol methylase
MNGEHDFLDIGCGKGASTETAAAWFSRWGVRGMGVDIDASVINSCKAKGFDATHGTFIDCYKAPALGIPYHAYNYVTLFHILEHLKSYRDAVRMLYAAHTMAREFAFICQPYFDLDGLLLEEGKKFFWSDMYCHPNRIYSI